MTTTQRTTTTARVRVAGPADQRDVGWIISRAFHDDPTMRWITPDEQRRALIGPAVFELYAEAFVPLGETYLTDDGSAVALWYGPGQEPVAEEEAEEFGQRVLDILGEEEAGRLFELDATFQAHVPEAPHFHLQLCGTLPERQGQGFGSALLAPMLSRLDREGTPAYLEATSLQNKRLFERHGFVATGTMTPAGGPTLTAMWREPAA